MKLLAVTRPSHIIQNHEGLYQALWPCGVICGVLGLPIKSPKAVRMPQDTHDNTFVEVAVTSPNTLTDMQTAQLNLEIATQNASLVYLQALKDYIVKRRGVIGDGWHVKFEYMESICKTSPIYCSPDGSRFDSMPKVAHYLGLLSASDSSDTNDNGGTQNGSYANGGNASKVDPMENGYRGSESSLRGLPVQFQDFIVISVGKINPRPSFYNTSQIWPIGYKSIWHDKLTGSVFTFNIFDSGDRGPIFRVHRKPCTKHSIPNASTVIYKLCGPSDEISSCVFPLQESQQLTNENFINGDIIGEFLVEGRTPSSAWQMVIETFIRACRQAFQDMKLLTFCCNHRAESQYFYTSYSNDSLNKFGGLNCPINNIPRFIQTIDQLEAACNVLRKWLQVDRFGLDAEFVQELIEQLPGVAACSEYISLDTRCQNKIAYTVRSGFFTGLRKYNSQPMISDSPVETDTRISPPGNEIASNLPRSLVGNVLQAYEFSLRFYNILGQEAPLSRQKLEYELLNPRIDGLNSLNDDNGCQSPLSNFHMAMLKMLVEDMLAKVSINYPSGAMESKPRKGRKKNIDVIVSGQTIKIGIFPVNEITWPELARRYILVLKSMDDNLDYLDISSHEYEKVFHCLNGNGGPLCGNLRGMAAIKADAVAIAEASKKIFSSVKSKIVDVVIDLKDLDIDESAIETKRTDDKPEWIDRLEPIQNLATNVGAKIRNRIRDSLNKGPPGWAAEMLRESISKDVYKGNAAGPTKRIVREVLNKAKSENHVVKKEVKESFVVKKVSDVIIKRCRMVLRSVAAQDENKIVFGLMAESLLKPDEFSRLLDFRTIDLRLDAGFYGGSHESFIEDVHEVRANLRITYRNKPKCLNLIESFFKKFEELYEQEVLSLVSRINGSNVSSEETKIVLNTMFADTITSTLPIAPWEEGICKVCGKDENDHVLLLCDRCNSEYHTYCLYPPLQRVPKKSWYCPTCISDFTRQAQEEDFDFSQPPKRMKIQREFTRSGLKEVANLADKMEKSEYWELGVKERVMLLQFLCDETLGSTVIRNHMSTDNCDANRNFLGHDSAGRLYWVLGRPGRLFVSGPDSDGEEFDTWNCYESDAEIEALVEWMRDDDAKEKELKRSIIKWQRNKSNDQNLQIDLQPNCSKSMVHVSNAKAAFEKKFGSIYRCDCLELVGSTRHHCSSCHSTCFSHEVHQCDTLEKRLTWSNGNPQDDKAAFLVRHNSRLTEAQNESPSCSSSRTLTGKAFEIIRSLKINLLDIEAALPHEAFRPSRGGSDKLRAWRSFLKSAQSIYEMAQATMILEDMITTEHLKKEWWYWSSPSTAAKISTVSSLALLVYALDDAIYYDQPPPPPPPPPVDPIESIAAPEEFMAIEEALKKSMEVVNQKSMEEAPKKLTPKKRKLNISTIVGTLNDAEPSEPIKKSMDEAPKKLTPKKKQKSNTLIMAGMSNDAEPFDGPGSKDKPKKKKLKVTSDL
ncbi:bromodomain-containing protein [Tanacetum coccineum]